MSDESKPKRTKLEQDKVDLQVYYKNLAEMTQNFDDELRAFNRLLNDNSIDGNDPD